MIGGINETVKTMTDIWSNYKANSIDVTKHPDITGGLIMSLRK